MRKIGMGAIVAALLGGAIYYVAAPRKTSYGAAISPAEKPTAIRELQDNPKDYVGREVVIQGKITKQCPTSGCWWYIDDGTGEIRADSTGGNFALPVGHEGSQVRTRGKVVETETGQVEIAALGAEL